MEASMMAIVQAIVILGLVLVVYFIGNKFIKRQSNKLMYDNPILYWRKETYSDFEFNDAKIRGVKVSRWNTEAQNQKITVKHYQRQFQEENITGEEIREMKTFYDNKLQELRYDVSLTLSIVTLVVSFISAFAATLAIIPYIEEFQQDNPNFTICIFVAFVLVFVLLYEVLGRSFLSQTKCRKIQYILNALSAYES